MSGASGSSQPLTPFDTLLISANPFAAAVRSKASFVSHFRNIQSKCLSRLKCSQVPCFYIDLTIFLASCSVYIVFLFVIGIRVHVKEKMIWIWLCFGLTVTQKNRKEILLAVHLICLNKSGLICSFFVGFSMNFFIPKFYGKSDKKNHKFSIFASINWLDITLQAIKSENDVLK